MLPNDATFINSVWETIGSHLGFLLSSSHFWGGLRDVNRCLRRLHSMKCYCTTFFSEIVSWEVVLNFAFSTGDSRMAFFTHFLNRSLLTLLEDISKLSMTFSLAFCNCNMSPVLFFIFNFMFCFELVLFPFPLPQPHVAAWSISIVMMMSVENLWICLTCWILQKQYPLVFISDCFLTCVHFSIIPHILKKSVKYIILHSYHVLSPRRILTYGLNLKIT